VSDRDKPEEEPLEADAELLPDRELTSLIDGNVVIPINGTVAANVLSEDAPVGGNAQEDVDVEQDTSNQSDEET
jgi:hypothetical protein